MVAAYSPCLVQGASLKRPGGRRDPRRDAVFPCLVQRALIEATRSDVSTVSATMRSIPLPCAGAIIEAIPPRTSCESMPEKRRIPPALCRGLIEASQFLECCQRE